MKYQVGDRINNITLIELIQKRPMQWLIKCELCGTIYARTVSNPSILTQCNACTDKTSQFVKHNEHKTRLYKVWVNMQFRCRSKTHPNAKYYANKGIKVCSEWEDFNTFKQWALNNGYQDNLTIDRIDSDKDYEPSNCRWITQAENTKPVSSKYITVNDITKNYREWAAYLGIHHKSIQHAVNVRNMNPEDYIKIKLIEKGL